MEKIKNCLLFNRITIGRFSISAGRGFLPDTIGRYRISGNSPYWPADSIVITTYYYFVDARWWLTGGRRASPSVPSASPSVPSASGHHCCSQGRPRGLDGRRLNGRLSLGEPTAPNPSTPPPPRFPSDLSAGSSAPRRHPFHRIRDAIFLYRVRATTKSDGFFVFFYPPTHTFTVQTNRSLKKKNNRL